MVEPFLLMTPSQRNRVLRMKVAGFSGREIARTLKVPQSAVWKYLQEKGYGRPTTARDHQKEARADIRSLNRPYKRCKECGGMVQLPCLACQLTNKRRAGIAAHY